MSHREGRSVSGRGAGFLVAGKRKRGSVGVWERESGNIAKIWADLMSGTTTVQDVLDRAQANWEASYEGLPA